MNPNLRELGRFLMCEVVGIAIGLLAFHALCSAGVL